MGSKLEYFFHSGKVIKDGEIIEKEEFFGVEEKVKIVTLEGKKLIVCERRMNNNYWGKNLEVFIPGYVNHLLAGKKYGLYFSIVELVLDKDERKKIEKILKEKYENCSIKFWETKK